MLESVRRFWAAQVDVVHFLSRAYRGNLVTCLGCMEHAGAMGMEDIFPKLTAILRGHDLDPRVIANNIRKQRGLPEDQEMGPYIDEAGILRWKGDVAGDTDLLIEAIAESIS